MNGEIEIDADVLDALKHARTEGTTLTLTQQLERKLYQRTAKVIELLGGKWNRGAKCHTFEDDCAERVDMAVMTGTVIDAKKLYQFFETPNALAEEMVIAAKILPGDTVLEPSAGKGALIAAMRRLGKHNRVIAVELNGEHALKLTGRYGEGNVTAINMDFTMYEPTSKFDRIIANPPFRNGQDCDHVKRMCSMLAPEGVCVTLTSPAWQYRQDAKHRAFRMFANAFAKVVREIPPGTFSESGTEIRTVMMVFEKGME